MDYEAVEGQFGGTWTHIQRSAHDERFGVARYEDPAGRSYWTPIRFTEEGLRSAGGATGHETPEAAWGKLNVDILQIDFDESVAAARD